MWSKTLILEHENKNAQYKILENNPNKICPMIGQKLCFYISMETQTLAWAADAMVARAKRNHVLIIKINKWFSFSSLQCFLKEIEIMFTVFLSS